MIQTTLPIYFDLVNTSSNLLTATITVDGIQYHHGRQPRCTATIAVPYDPEQIHEHSFELTISGKRSVIDQCDDVEATIEIRDLRLADIAVFGIIQPAYQHDRNGFGEAVTELLHTPAELDLVLGYDGVWRFDFFTPMSYWLVSQSFY